MKYHLDAREGDLAQLVGLTHKHFIFMLQSGGDFQRHRGVIKHDDLIGKPWGSQVFSHTGAPFFLLQPSLADILNELPRNTQILYDVVDGTDNFPRRYCTNDACVILKKPNVYGSIFRFEGQLAVFDARVGPCYRCLYRELPPPGLVPSCAEGGVLGVLPGIIGTMQALETLKLLLGIGRPAIGSLLLFDALQQAWQPLTIRKDPDCPICGASPSITSLRDEAHHCSLTPPPVPGLAPREVAARLAAGDALQLVDVREPHEWDITNLADLGNMACC